MRHFRRLSNDVRGATTVEYALILALVFIAMLSAVQGYGAALGDLWNYVAGEVLKT